MLNFKIFVPNDFGNPEIKHGQGNSFSKIIDALRSQKYMGLPLFYMVFHKDEYDKDYWHNFKGLIIRCGDYLYISSNNLTDFTDTDISLGR